ncbi:MAG: hypothetical protein WKF32_05970 [Thermoleophilaceae bacterium]
MVLGCIDIGSNTTRLLVADVSDGSLRVLLAERSFTRIGRSVGATGRVPEEKIAETAQVVGAQAAAARDLGAHRVIAVATAAVRNAANRDELVGALEARLGAPLRVLSGEEEARLSFLGATGALAETAPGAVAVIDVGGGSTEIALGTPGAGVDWWRSLPVGSGLLADLYLRSDPPAATEIEAARGHVARSFEGLAVPPATNAVAVGGTATSLRRMAGDALTADTLERCVEMMGATPVAEVAERFDLDSERVRLMPAGMLLLAAVSRCLSLPMSIAIGGLREGAIMELMHAAGDPREN